MSTLVRSIFVALIVSVAATPWLAAFPPLPINVEFNIQAPVP
jgi:hypothetical protein